MPSHPQSHPDRSRRDRPRIRAALGLLLVPFLWTATSVHPLRATRALARGRALLEGGRTVAVGHDLLLQRQLWDCGPTALHNLLRAQGTPSPGPDALARTSGTGIEGTTLGGLVRSARAQGAPLRARRPSAAELLTLPTPYLAWLGEGHFVTVLAVDADGRLTVHDPGFGAYRVPLGAFRRRWGGVVAHPTARSSDRSGRTRSAIPERLAAPGIHPPSDGR